MGLHGLVQGQLYLFTLPFATHFLKPHPPREGGKSKKMLSFTIEKVFKMYKSTKILSRVWVIKDAGFNR
jgi:hypothetical protein